MHQLRAKSTLRNTVKNIAKNKPWSALYGRVTRGSQLSPGAHKDLPPPVTTPLDQVNTYEMEFDMTAVKGRRYKESKEHREFEEEFEEEFNNIVSLFVFVFGRKEDK